MLFFNLLHTYTRKRESNTANPITTTISTNLQKINKPKKIQNPQKHQINFPEI
jgi:hypothetical protein